ncbi:MAG TPA: ATP-binding protein [Clostridia bacterium]
MSKAVELKYDSLKREINPDCLSFNDTSELEPLEGIIGQERAVRALDFGLKIKTRGYNIYISGMTGTGKTSYAKKHIEKIAAKGIVSCDWCYVYNFDKPNRPMAISLPAGMGKLFQKDMENFVKILKPEITKSFDSEEYEKEKANILKQYQVTRDELLDQLNDDAKKHGFKVKTTSAGIYFLPVIEGKAISEQEYGELDETLKHELNEKSSTIQIETIDIIRKIKNIEKDAEEKVLEWDNRIALFAVGMHINDLKEKYKDFEKITQYLENVQQDILDNLDDFREDETSEEQTAIPWLRVKDESPAEKYNVNLFVDNSELTGAPVVVDFNPTFYNLLGKFEYENEFGTVTTDFTMMKAGLFHRANGGYLILQANDLMNNAPAWEALKRVLKTRQICIENMKEQSGLVAVSALSPEPIPLDVKVILVGSSYVYQLLYEYDEDFRKLFKIKADFDEEMDWTLENLQSLSRFIAAFCKRENAPHFDRTGVAKVIEHSSWLTEDQNKLTTRFNDIVEVLAESCAWAEIEGAGIVSESHVKKALNEKIHRNNKYDRKLLELLSEGTIMVDTEGEVVGQINGLTILDMGDYSFGKPSRITATTYIGESGIVNIEREVEMSGTSHTKGVLILSGYIGQMFAQEIPLSLSASLCFEQLYSGVDGDSASSAELYAILSSLAEVPIKQSIAVTGSVNQRGEIQPIGGATSKIEGYFELCRLRGLTGNQGVIIPHQNVRNLVLNDEVIEAVKRGKFHIYPVKTISEGIEILTGVRAGEKGKTGKYPRGTINYMVYEKLKRFAQTVAGFGKQEKGEV